MHREWLEGRDGTSEWHRLQAGLLHNHALENQSATALVYAALEARLAIERLVFELSVVATGGGLSEDQLQQAGRRHGIFGLLEEALEHYRQHMLFQNMCQAAGGGGLSFPIPDIRRCKRLITRLSEYCHAQADPALTVRDTSGTWLARGLAVVEEACTFLDPLLQGARGILDPETMPREVRELFDQFLRGDLDEESAKTRLRLMQPVLEQRLRQRTGDG